jgi:flagellar M-ring protein FliF
MVTPFQQEMNRLRALEGELARTIRGIQGVRQVRVHLVLPRREAFSRDRAEAQASIALTMAGSARMDREGVQSVLHMVAAAVPGLSARNISIVDSRGEVLARGGQAVGGAATAATHEELRLAHEMRISRSVEELLERSLGPGRVSVRANVEMDFDRVETREERFDPENQVPRSTQSVNESNRSSEPGNVSVQNNLPGAEGQGGGGGSQESRQEETTNFEIGRSTRNTLREHPVVRRVSIAVIVDGVTEPVEGGAPRMRERNAEELARIAALVRSAVGFNEQRGDQVRVDSIPFFNPPAETAPAGLFGLDVSQTLVARLMETAILALVALLAIFLVARPVANRLAMAIAPPALVAAGPDGAVPALASSEGGPPPGTVLPDGTVVPALPPGSSEQTVALAHVEGQLRVSSITRLVELVQRNPDQSLAVIRRWLAPEDAS